MKIGPRLQSYRENKSGHFLRHDVVYVSLLLTSDVNKTRTKTAAYKTKTKITRPRRLLTRPRPK